MSAATRRHTSVSRQISWTDPLLLLGTAAALLSAALLTAVAVAVLSTGHTWPPNALVPTDGEPHDVPVSTSDTAMLWTIEGGDADCTITSADGTELPQQPVSASYRQHDMAWDWVGVATVDPSSSTVTATCTGVPGGSVALAPTPRGPAALAGLSRWFAVPAALAVIGLAVGLVGLTRGRRR